GAVKRVPLRSKSGGDTVSALCEDSGGTLWLGMFGGGLSRYHAGRFELYRAPEMLPDNGILAILKDGERNLWVGTRAGLLRLSQTAVQTLTTHDGLADDNIRTTYADRDGAIWLVSFNGPAHRLVGDRAVRVPIPALPARSMLRTVFRDRRGALWIGTTGQGVVRVGNGTAVHYTRKEGLVNDFVRVFCEDREGRIWIGTDSGLSCWTAGRFRNFQIQEGLAYGSVRAIAEDRTGDLWVGTDAGLSRFHDGAFLRDPLLERFRNEKIWAIHEDARGALWLGTRGAGLFRIENGRVANLTTRNGLPDDNIYQILEDGRGNLWMSNPTGVFCASRRSIEAVAEGGTQQFAAARYGTSDGMTVPQINGGVQPAGCITSAGILWFPSIRGAVRIDPDKIRAGRAASALIEEVVADGHAIAAADGMELPPGDGKLEIHYTAPKLLSPETVRFRYMLEGFDRNWTDALERRVAYYTNLPPREYRFRVIAIDGNGVPPVSEASLGLRLRPHYYETRWFYSFCTLLFFASMWCVFQLHTRQTKARYAAVLAERNRMARDMHDTLIQGCVGISTLLEAASAVRGSAPEMIHELLDRARDQVHSTLQEARQAVWDLRQISLDTRGLVSALSQVAEQAGREYGFEVRFESGGTPAVLDYRTERGLLLVVREAVRNAIVHGAPREVRVSLRFERRRLRLEIADDGCGFHPAAETATPGHCGLVGMRERVEQLGGKFELRSTAGLGTNILVTLPFNRGRSVLEGRKAES
ncbi:MAG: histidine kinase, partial [Acidobacteria bacterium]|nr:histidine kinase [Acidobacteriota bacterium]